MMSSPLDTRFPLMPYHVKTERVDQHLQESIDRHQQASNDRHQMLSNDRDLHVTYQVRLPNIDVARLNTTRYPSQPSETSTHNNIQQSEDAAEPIFIDKDTEEKTFRRKKNKVPKHLRREANNKKMDSFIKRILRIPEDNQFNEAYYTYRLWMFSRESKETDIERMFHQIREKMKQRVVPNKKSDPGKFVVHCVIGGSYPCHSVIQVLQLISCIRLWQIS